MCSGSYKLKMAGKGGYQDEFQGGYKRGQQGDTVTDIIVSKEMAVLYEESY